MANRLVTKDLSQRDSITNPDFISRLGEAMLNDSIAEKLYTDQAIKSGKIPKVKGCSPKETELMERITRATFQPENSTSYRTAQRINEHLKQVNANLREDKAREKDYQKTLDSII